MIITEHVNTLVLAPPVCQTDDFLLEYFESGGGNGSEENNPDIDEDFITVRDQESWFTFSSVAYTLVSPTFHLTVFDRVGLHTT